jgi:hypothetical protein
VTPIRFNVIKSTVMGKPISIRDKLRLYELSVQNPGEDAKLYRRMALQLRPEFATASEVLMREDFCGTFALSCAWIRLSPRHRALALDLDAPTLEDGRARNLPSLSPEQKKRLTVLQRDVATVTRPRADLIIAGNFSFFYLKSREQAIRYLKHARQSLKPGGLHFLEVAGGPGFLKKMTSRRTITPARGKPFTYHWQQRGYDPVTSEAIYAIHFTLADGTRVRDAFTYDWRLWNIRELRDCMLEAGYRHAHVYWEKEVDPDDYELSEKGADDDVWIAYVAGEA